MRVMIVVTHLLGTGHLARALTLGRAMSAAGQTVCVVSGGMAVPHFDAEGLKLVQLPPVRSDGTDFTQLLDTNGDVATDAYLAARIRLARDTLDAFAPDVLITELFPFGRRILRDEFQALLSAAKDLAHAPLVLCSIRDILAPPSKPSKAAFADDMVARFYDGVLVHADPEVITLDQSWPMTKHVSKCLHYTGFVAPPAPQIAAQKDPLILVSAGGGTVGDGIFAAAMDAASGLQDYTWHLLVSGPEERRARLQSQAPANVHVEAPRSDFRTLLGQACASVSMCGYNTALDLLQTGVPAVVVPFDDGGEVEQGLRAQALAKQPGITVLKQDSLLADGLAQAVRAVMRAPGRAPRKDGMDGAAQTAKRVATLWQAHR